MSRKCKDGCTCLRHTRSGNRTKGRPELKAYIANNREEFLASMNDPERRRKISESLTGRKLSKEHAAKARVATLGKKMPPRSEEYRKHLSERMKEMWNDPEKARKFAHWPKESSIEILVRDELDRRNIEYLTGQVVAGLLPDIVLKNRRLIIEVNGDYWHSSDEAKERDAMKEMRYKEVGYDVAWIWESDIERDIVDAVDKALSLEGVMP